MSSQPNQSLIDGIRCFQALTSSEVPLGTKDMSDLLNINVTRVNRLLKTLQSIGMAEQNQQKKYLPGPAVHLLAAQSFHSSELFKAATRVAVGCNYTDRTLAIGILWDEYVVYMYHALPGQNPSEGLGGYRINHILESTIGQVLLSEFSDEEIELKIASWDSKLQDQIREKVITIRKKGYACSVDDLGSVRNIATVFVVGSAKAGIAFTDFTKVINDPSDIFQELCRIKSKIEAI